MVLQILIIMNFIILYRVNDVYAYEDPNSCWTNFSNIRVTQASGCGAQGVYNYCTFYANFWNPNGNIHLRSAHVKIYKNGSLMAEKSSYSSDDSHYFNWTSMSFYFEEAGTYTVEKWATTLDGETLNWDEGTLIVHDISQCGTNLDLSKSSVYLNMTGTYTTSVVSTVSGIKPDKYSIQFEKSNSNISCTWGDWYTDSNGNRACSLNITGNNAGNTTITVSFKEKNTGKVITSKTISVEIGPNYNVYYNSNGGIGAPSSQTKPYGVTLELSNTKPTRTGHKFKGWSTSSTATVATYLPGESYTANSGTTLYAVWEKETYDVYYNANEGTGAPSTQTKYYGTTLTLSDKEPTRTGYTFLGWSTDRNAESAVYDAGGSYTDNTSATLYAIWKINTYTVTYDANGGTGAPSAQIKTYGQPLILSSEIPALLGHIFLGWSKNSIATTADYKAGEEYSENDNAVLYAVWESDEPENKLQIAYDANGGSGAPGTQIKQPDAELILSDIKPTRPGYTFLGWSTDRNADSATYEAGGTYTDNRSATLYAVWKVNTYTITYANGGTETPSAQTKTHGQTLTLSNKVPVRQGYTFLGWSESQTATAPTYQAGGEYTEDRGITLYAVWKKNESAVNPPSDPGTSKDNPTGNKTDKLQQNSAKKVQKITTKASVFTKAYGSKIFSLGAKAGRGAKLTYKSSNSKVAKVSGSGKVTVKKYGTAKITIRAEATKEYQPAVRTVTVKVVPKTVSLKSVKSPYARRMEVSWKKNKDASGYEIYLSKRKDFKKWTVKRSIEKSKSLFSVNNCETKSTYYVKIRAYKKVGKTKYYGGWSKVKKVKIK